MMIRSTKEVLKINIDTHMTFAHSFHIPVMGIGFTIDTPLKVSQYGIDSVISLVDDILLEKLRKMYCDKHGISYFEITEQTEDYRAIRITSYLDLIHDLALIKFENFKNETIKTVKGIKQYFDLLPDTSIFKQEFLELTKNHVIWDDVRTWVKRHMPMGMIDVNIMTKVDKENYTKGIKLHTEYNDAHAALRGFANSSLNSSVILSAGMNPRLYSYLEQFKDFYPDINGNLKKRIVLKVSDYRSALIQGKFLAKKGLWVSEYRVESGLNCGGHAFATDGYLLGPILNQFKENRNELLISAHELLVYALFQKDIPVPETELPLRITAQGGVGTAEEHQFIIQNYHIDSVGWGTPFLLVPEATTVDKVTLQNLVEAKEDDVYLSNTSPLGIPFYTLRGNTKDAEKSRLIAKGRPGSSCPKKFVALNKDYTKKGICTASRHYQNLKIKELEKEEVTIEEYRYRYNKITEKSCTCVGLGTSALLAYNLDTKVEGKGVSICPGPNMAYFSKIIPLKDMIGHIYGTMNVINRTDRPNMFIKELSIYIQYLQEQIEEMRNGVIEKKIKFLNIFFNNLSTGIAYYQSLSNFTKMSSEPVQEQMQKDLTFNLKALLIIRNEIDGLGDLE